MKKLLYILLLTTALFSLSFEREIYYTPTDLEREIISFLKSKQIENKKDNRVATLKYKKGVVKVKHKDSIKRESIKIGNPIFAGDTIITYNSVAEIRLKDNSIIKLSPHSKIVFINSDKLSQKEGKIFYKIEKRSRNHKLAVTTTFTTIGVKGTNFIINPTKIALKEGILSVKGLDELLQAGNKVIFDGKKLSVSKMDKEDYSDFNKFEQEFNTTIIENNRSKKIEEKEVLKIEVRNPKN